MTLLSSLLLPHSSRQKDDLLLSSPTLVLIVYLVVIAALLTFLHLTYRISPFHPLARVPGPLFPRLSSLWLTYHAWIGDEVSTVHRLHSTYSAGTSGKARVVRTGPNSVDIADGAALSDIYGSGVSHHGFLKPAFYGNFDVDGHKTIFSEVVPSNRAPRAKAVVGIFSTAELRKRGGKVTCDCVERFVDALEQERNAEKHDGEDKKTTNLLDLTRPLAIDTVTGYLFGRRFGEFDEQERQTARRNAGLDINRNQGKALVDHFSGTSAAGMVDSFVAVGRFWYLPAWAFSLVEWLDSRFGAGSGQHVELSLDLVEKFTHGIVEDAKRVFGNEKPDPDSKKSSPAVNSPKPNEKGDGDGEVCINGVTPSHYPVRLLRAGFSPSEVKSQCKDLIFAGTDSTGMNMATICFMLRRYPHTYARLREEIAVATADQQLLSTAADDDNVDVIKIQSLPYLRGVVREGLRLSMANPSRLPRVVPPGGWTFKDMFFPAGTEVSCTPYELHMNAAVFADPEEFRPERWMGEDVDEQMNRDAIPFGLGSRQCIARNLATMELFCATYKLAQRDALRGASCKKDRIEILEWFNSKVVGEKIDLIWKEC